MLTIDNKIHAYEYQMNFQLPHTPIMDGIVSLHNDIMGFLVAIIIVITYILIRVIYYFNWNTSQYPISETAREHFWLEIFWTVLPILVLLLIGVSSLSLLGCIERSLYSIVTIHVMGHQWYWTYDYSQYNFQFDSCMLLEEDLNKGELRNLEVDNRLLIPYGHNIRVIVSSADVIHSWAIPSFGVKVDACPGRLNQCHILAKKVGIYYGQCSEICGVGHGFMPIVVQCMPMHIFKEFIYNNNNNIYFMPEQLVLNRTITLLRFSKNPAANPRMFAFLMDDYLYYLYNNKELLNEIYSKGIIDRKIFGF